MCGKSPFFSDDESPNVLGSFLSAIGRKLRESMNLMPVWGIFMYIIFVPTLVIAGWIPF